MQKIAIGVVLATLSWCAIADGRTERHTMAVIVCSEIVIQNQGLHSLCCCSLHMVFAKVVDNEIGARLITKGSLCLHNVRLLYHSVSWHREIRIVSEQQDGRRA